MLVKSGVRTKTVNILKNFWNFKKKYFKKLTSNLQLLLLTIYFWKLKYQKLPIA